MNRRRIPISDRTELVKQADGQWRAESRTGYEQWLIDDWGIAPDEHREFSGCLPVLLATAAAWGLIVWATWRWVR